MKELLCPRCGSFRFRLFDTENGVVEAKCVICEKVVKLKKIEEEEQG
jgi:uncharacterized Zn finger protein (UPF0148 family)